MIKLAVLLLLAGNICHMAEPKGIWTNSVWITSTLTATLAVVAANSNGTFLVKATAISGTVTMLCVVCGLFGLRMKVRRWLKEENQ